MNDPALTATPAPCCAACGAPVDAARIGAMCPACLLSLATHPGDGADDAAPDLLDAFRHDSFGDYELLEQIARGGMGVVYRARHTRLNREVALKMILAGELAGPDTLRMFQTEARAAAALHHPNIVPVYEIGEHEMQPYFSMRFVPGGQTIADWSREHAGDWKAIARQVATVARAIAYAHERGILHRDIKPSNILWDAAEGPQVTDFGLAKLLDAVDGTVTISANIIGSPSYMAPEQCGGRAAEITIATDIYGIGAVLYELLAGCPPFIGKSVVETARLVVEKDPPPLPEIPRDLATVCRKCLAKNPPDRYPSAAALADDLERFSRGEPVSAVPLAPVQRLVRWARRKPAPAALGLMLTVSFLGGLGGILWQWQRAENANEELRQTITRLEWRQLDRWLANDEHANALAFLARAIRDDPADWRAAMFAMSIIDQHAFPIPVGPSVEMPGPPSVSPCLSPDGRHVAAAFHDSTLRVWETTTATEITRHTLDAPISALTFSGENTHLIAALADGRILAFPTSSEPDTPPITFQRAATAAPHELHASGKTLLARTDSGTESWDITRPANPPRWHPFDQPAGAAITGGGLVLQWSRNHATVTTPDGEILLETTPEARFTNGAASPGGSVVALIDGSFQVRLRDLAAGVALPAIDVGLQVIRYVSLSPDGARLTIAGSQNRILTYDTRSGMPLPASAATHRYHVQRLVSSPGGKFHVSLGNDGTVHLIDAANGEPVISPVAIGAVFHRLPVAAADDGRTLMVQLPDLPGQPPTLTFWKPTTTRPSAHQVFDGQRSFNAARLSPDGSLGAVGLYPSQRVVVHDLESGDIRLDATANGLPYVILFSPAHDRAYTLTANGWLHGWELDTGHQLWPARQHSGLIRPACISADGTRILAGHNNGLIRIYDTATGDVLRELSHPGEVKVLHWEPNGGRRFLSASTDKLAHVWDADTGEKLRTFPGHTHTIISAAWSPDSRRIATASYDGTARLWDARTGKDLSPPMPHASWLAHITFSPDGTRLATACRDGTARLWSSEDGTPLTPPIIQPDTAQTIRFTADDKTFLVRTHAGFRFHDTATGDPSPSNTKNPWQAASAWTAKIIAPLRPPTAPVSSWASP